MQPTVNQIIEAQDQIAPKVDPVLEVLETKEVGQRLMRLSGYGYYPVQQFQDAFERMTPERAFAIYVLAQALDDIEPVDVRPPSNFGPASITRLFAAQDKARRNRIRRLQQIEAVIRRDVKTFLVKYRQTLKQHGGLQARDKNCNSNSAHQKGKTWRQVFERKRDMFNAEAENRDPVNASLQWFLTERGMVEFWCHMADVSVERCYLAVERRLLSLGRCSIALRAIIKELRKGRTWDYEIELNPLNRYENRAWQHWIDQPST